MAVRHLGFSLAAALALLPAALPGAPYLVKDLNASPALNNGQVALGERGIGPEVSYFSAGDPAHGVELWRSDGTPGGTERLTDICAGRCDSAPANITVHAGRVFFVASDGFSGNELWVSDGTPGSERRVRDLCPGPCTTYPGFVEEVGGHLLFIPYFPEEPARTELWQTDGTREGTIPLKVLCTDGCGIFSQLIPIGERGIFLVNLVDRPSGQELWVTDGTAAGTRSLLAVGGDFLFDSGVLADEGDEGFAWIWTSGGLWRTDGTTAGTVHLKRIEDLAAHPDRAYLSQAVLWHGLFFGILGDGAMIRSDGTPEGTFRIADFSSSFFVGGLSPLAGELLFEVNNFAENSVLWSSRGTADTTGPRIDLGPLGRASSLTALRGSGGDRAVFRWAPDASPDQTELWVTDATAAGTRRLAIPPGVLHNGTFFTTGDGRAFFQLGYGEDDLWITDGTEAGTHEVRNFRDAPGAAGPQQQAALGDRLVFSARAPNASTPLFVSDGTAAGTGLLSAKANDAFSFFRSGDRLLFSSARSSGYPPFLWATDGTPGGTALVSKRAGFSNPARLGGQILFSGLSYLGVELWKTDSLTRSVDLVRDIDPFIVDSGFHHMCAAESSLPIPGGVVGGRLLLAAGDGRSGRELWASDGTPAGTVLVRDINPGRSPGAPTPCEDVPSGPHRHDTGLSSNPSGFAVLGSVALFAADDGVHGRELWITNGTFPGTHRVADLVPGPRGSEPHDLVRFHDGIYFLATNIGAGGPGESLWRTDGTNRGTTRVRDLTLDGLPSWGRDLTVAAGRLFFTVYNETTGDELWASTGIGEETGLVADLNPGPGNSSPQFLTAVGGLLLFAADDGLTGLEAWRSDGTAAGTFRIGDIAPGRDASSPGPFTALSHLVMTGADDGVHGRELWAIPKTDLSLEP
jgi:ELWxxDGT repeat protein